MHQAFRWTPAVRLTSMTAALAVLATTAHAGPPSWVFAPSTYTHDPVTGARVAQYQRVAPVEELADQRMVTSRYRRIRTTLRGADGSVDSTYEVQNFGNGRGGLDAEWERFHDAWRQSLLSGSFFFQNQPVPLGAVYGLPGDAFNPTYGPSLPGGAFGDPRFRAPFPPSGAYGPQPGFGVPGGFAPRPGFGPGAGFSRGFGAGG
ncbi:MAG: hypothetical protein AAF790_11005 [Planctomycetota bacterium]